MEPLPLPLKNRPANLFTIPTGPTEYFHHFTACIIIQGLQIRPILPHFAKNAPQLNTGFLLREVIITIGNGRQKISHREFRRGRRYSWHFKGGLSTVTIKQRRNGSPTLSTWLRNFHGRQFQFTKGSACAPFDPLKVSKRILIRGPS